MTPLCFSAALLVLQPFKPALLLCALPFLFTLEAHADDESLALGNPSGALALQAPTAIDPDASAPNLDFNNVLLDKPEFALSYNKTQGGPNWVSWHLAKGDIGRSGRSDKFSPDETLPRDWWIVPSDYRGSGYDRGHQCPSGDRTSDADINSITFLMSNMLPQAPQLNRNLWAKFEEYCRSQLKSGDNEEYIMCGGVGTKERIGEGRVNVPASCWKIAVILPTGDDDLARIDDKTRVVAINIPNDDAALEGKTWREGWSAWIRSRRRRATTSSRTCPKACKTCSKRKPIRAGRAPGSRLNPHIGKSLVLNQGARCIHVARPCHVAENHRRTLPAPIK